MSAASVLEQPLVVTLFRDRFATVQERCTLTLPELAERCRNCTAPAKERLPWIKLATFGARRTERGSLRHDGNVVGITGIEGDYDGEAMPLDEAADRLTAQGVACVLTTSPSHTEARPRWRVLAPVSRPLEPDRRRHLVARLNGLFGGGLAAESFVLSQSYYVGSVDRNPDHRVELIDGRPIDAHDDLDRIACGPAARGAAITSGIRTDPRNDAELVRRVVTGEAFHTELTALAARYIGRDMAELAVVELLQGPLLSHPESARDARWRARFASIPELVASARRKFTRGPGDQLARFIVRNRHDPSLWELVERKAELLGLTHDQADAAVHAAGTWIAQHENHPMNRSRT